MESAEAKKLSLSAQTNTLIFVMIAIGIASFVVGQFTNSSRTWYAFLVNHLMFMGLGIGSILFMGMHYLSASSWVVGVRRIFEAFSSYLYPSLILTVVLLFGLSKIYPWTNHEWMLEEPNLRHKVFYFSTGFFSVRVIFFMLLMCFFTWKMIGNSLKQDVEGGTERTLRQKPLSAIMVVLFAPLFTVFSADLIKSVDPTWFSTIFGVYAFAGFLQAAMAATIIALRALKKHGYLKEIGADHFHDLGKYMFGWSIFWAYIWVSQFLLIWYANLPEETSFYVHRQVPGWLWLNILVPTVRFTLPFLLLLPREAKRRDGYLSKVAWLVLVGAWLDMYLMIMPILTPKSFTFGWQDYGLLIGFAGVFLFAARKFLSRNFVIPVKDPFLHETLHHHVM